MTTTSTAGISWQWNIYRDGYRRATDPAQHLHLMATNRRTRGGWGPVRWWVYGPNGQLATGEVWQGGRYASLVRQAMWEAEQWVAAHANWAACSWCPSCRAGTCGAHLPAPCDDCYRSDGTHDPAVEH